MTDMYTKKDIWLNDFLQNEKAYKRITTRSEKLSITFKALVMIASCLIWLQ